MTTAIRITAAGLTLTGQLADTPTGRALAGALPVTGTVNRWGGEIYFAVPVSAHLEADSRDVLQPGEIAFWPPGNALCIFFGPTPASTADEPRAASPVNVCGKLTADPANLWNVQDRSAIRIEHAARE